MDWKGLNEKLEAIEAKLGYIFQEKRLLALAFTHCSYINEHQDVVEHNERLEFLGDSVLGLLIANYLYTLYPQMPEGELSYLRSRLVEANSCMLYVQKLELESYLLLGRGERMNAGRGRSSILSDLFEAIVGAIYVDGGIMAARDFLFQNFAQEMHAIIQRPLCNWKAKLQDLCQKKYQKPPFYQVLEEKGPDHNKIFTMAVMIDGVEVGRGVGPSKKEAQQIAAAKAVDRLLEAIGDRNGI